MYAVRGGLPGPLSTCVQLGVAGPTAILRSSVTPAQLVRRHPEITILISSATPAQMAHRHFEITILTLVTMAISGVTMGAHQLLTIQNGAVSLRVRSGPGIRMCGI